VGQAVEQCAGQPFGAEGLGPLVEGQVAGDERCAALVALAEDLEEQLGAGLGERNKAEFVDDEELVGGKLSLEAQQTLLVSCLNELVDERASSPSAGGRCAGSPSR